jgi:hypothetical protein
MTRTKLQLTHDRVRIHNQLESLLGCADQAVRLCQ